MSDRSLDELNATEAETLRSVSRLGSGLIRAALLGGIVLLIGAITGSANIAWLTVPVTGIVAGHALGQWLR